MPLITVESPKNVNFDPGNSWVEEGFRIAPKTKNFMRWLAWDSCAVPFWVIAVTFVPAFLEALITVRVWDINDLIRENARTLAGEPPRGRFRGGKHSRVGRVPGKEPPTKRISKNALTHLLRWTQPLETLGFALLMYAAADQFFFRWQSLIEAVAPCETPQGSFQRSAENQSWNMLFAGGPANMPILEQNTGGWGNNAFVVNVPPGNYFVAFSATLTPTFPATYEAGIQLFTPGIIGETITKSGLQELTTGSDTGFIVIARFFVSGFAGTAIGWQTYGATVPVGVTAKDAHIVVSRSINSLAI